MGFKIGDIVKIKENLSSVKDYKIKAILPMEKYKGEIAEVSRIDTSGDYKLDIDYGQYFWSEDMLEPYIATIKKSNLQDGDYITFRNKVKAIKSDKWLVGKNLSLSLSDYNNKLEHNFNSNYDIVKTDRPIKYRTIYKNDEILDSTEKKYLAEVIRPFRDKIKTITKELYVCHSDLCYLNILLRDNDCANLPSFNPSTMYVGMKADKEYTLEELGL